MEKNKLIKWGDTLESDRKRVTEIIKSEIKIEGYPIPIVKGKLDAIVAPSHSGKTIYALYLMFELARGGHKIVFLTTEEDHDSIVEKTLEIPKDDPAFNNISIFYKASFNKETLTQFIRMVSEEGYDFLIIDYLKKSMWENYTSDHVVMEEINSTILNTMASLQSKITTFAFVQGNREAFESLGEKKFAEIRENPSQVALLIDGGMPTYRSADNLLFIRKHEKQRSLFVAKSRRHGNLLGKSYAYTVLTKDFRINIGEGK